MTTEIIALISGLTGAVIGAASSVLVILIQEHHQWKRERTRLAAELGMKDFDNALEVTKRMQRPVRLQPLVSAVLFHEKIIKQLEQGYFSVDDYKRIMAEYGEITRVIDEISEERKNNDAEPPASADAPTARG